MSTNNHHHEDPSSLSSLKTMPFPSPSTLNSSSSSSSPSSFKLRKIPPIPIRRIRKPEAPLNDTESINNDDGDDTDGGDKNDDKEKLEKRNYKADENSPIIMASALGLNHIRTRSLPIPSPLRFSSSAATSSYLGNAQVNNNNNINDDDDDDDDDDVDEDEEEEEEVKTGVDKRLNGSLIKFFFDLNTGKKISWGEAKPFRAHSQLNPAMESNHAAFFAKEIQSPRFQAILRVTSGRMKKTPDIKSFSHELNSKGVRAFPVWKSRAFGHMEEVMVAIRMKFIRLKEEVDSDLGIFAGDLVGILEKTSDTHPKRRESLEDLLVVARQCAKMSSNEFWVKGEGIVQNLDDKRQELPMGIVKQAHTRLLFILTRCTRLVQFQKESGYDEDKILGIHQCSDLGVYREQIIEIAQQDFSGPLVGWKTAGEKQRKKSRGIDQDTQVTKQDQVDQSLEVGTAKSVDSTASSFRMSSWRKLPSAAEKNRKDTDVVQTPFKDKSEPLLDRDDYSENLETPHHPPSPGTKRVSWGLWVNQHNVAYENSMICRICEVEIPIVHVEEHSLICTIADRCDLKGFTVNERLERVAETLEKILRSWSQKTTPKSTPKRCDTPRASPEVERVPTSGIHEVSDGLSPKRNNFSSCCSEEMLDVVPDSFVMEDLNVFPEISCEARSTRTPDADKKTSSRESLTPRSPLLTPRTSQIGLLLSGQRTITELEGCHQISKLLDIARSVASLNDNDYSALEGMLDCLEDLKYSVQDRKVDALIVETFGRRIEKLLLEKYVRLCTQIDDEKSDPSNQMADEDSSEENDAVRSLRASPVNMSSKDRTSIDDFEIIKPISRGAFGRVFLARKRATGDLFAIKVLRKADMICKNAVESILEERKILISVCNPFVVRFFYSFTCSENLYLVMEYLNGGDLYSLLRNLGCLDEDMARMYIAEVVLALEYLHSSNVIHRDLKPDNLLINQDGHIKLTDFGLSKVGLINSTDDLSVPLVSGSGFLDDDELKGQSSSKREERQKHSVVGTPDYLAPEILLGMGHGATADWWSVGIILFELLVGIPPFNADTPQKIFDNVMNRDIPWPRVPEEMSFDACDLIDKLLTENPLQRLGAIGAREAMFIPSGEAHDTSYFLSRYIWNPEGENVHGSSDFEDLTDTCSSGSFSNTHDVDVDEYGSMAEFGAPTLDVKYSFSNFSFKNLSQLASINHDLVVKSTKEAADASKPPVP
ncbi:hypothetical protein POTOM_050913 [Populus tomentosa]|uniref:non-specific serine/threonine protein kinase n=1 Tax=Populus tomentosa TaxID=118781 RepID=A0A8X7YD12_POPTO|nr:hypothetical protein POTOM_050913 [Populus tomentosa]